MLKDVLRDRPDEPMGLFWLGVIIGTGCGAFATVLVLLWLYSLGFF